MAGVYRPRHPERTGLYRVLFHYFDRFLAEYEGRFEKECGFFRPIIKEVVERYLDCGNPRCGFARIRCPDCHAERLLMFSCRTRGFCPSCHAKRLKEWGGWRSVIGMAKTLKRWSGWTTWSLPPGSPPTFPTMARAQFVTSASTPTPIGEGPKGKPWAFSSPDGRGAPAHPL